MTTKIEQALREALHAAEPFVVSYYDYQHSEEEQRRALALLKAALALSEPAMGEAVCKTCNGTRTISKSEMWLGPHGEPRGSGSIGPCPDCPQPVLYNATPAPGVAPRVEGTGASGHYLKIERGEWVVRQGTGKQEFPASGWSYIGSLTREESEEVGAFIDALMKRKEGQPAPVAAAEAVDVDWLANVIRIVDGENKLGAGALAESICAALAHRRFDSTGVPR